MVSGPDPATLLKTILSAYPKGIGVTALSRKAHMHRNVAAKYLAVLLASDQVEMQKIGMTKLYVLKEVPDAGTHLTYEKELEEKTRQMEHDIAFLSEWSAEFSNITPETDIYELIGEGLRVIVPDAVVSMASFDHQTNSLTIRSITGDDNGVFLKNCPGIIGLNLPIKDQEAINSLASGQIHQLPGGIYVLSFGQIPAYACKRIEEGLALDNIYFASMASMNTLYCSVILFRGTKGPLEKTDLLNAYIKISTLAYQRWIDGVLT